MIFLWGKAKTCLVGAKNVCMMEKTVVMQLYLHTLMCYDIKWIYVFVTNLVFVYVYQVS